MCGISVQTPVSPLYYSPEQCMNRAVSLSDLSVQGEIRHSLSPSVNPLYYRWRMSINLAFTEKVCCMEMVDYTLNAQLYYLGYLPFLRNLVEE